MIMKSPGRSVEENIEVTPEIPPLEADTRFFLDNQNGGQPTDVRLIVDFEDYGSGEWNQIIAVDIVTGESYTSTQATKAFGGKGGKLVSFRRADVLGKWTGAGTTSPPASTTPPSSVTVAAPPPTSPPAPTTPTSKVTVAAPPPIPDLANLPLPPMEPVGTGSIDPGMGPSVGPLGTGPGGLLVGERYLPTIIINDPDVRPLTNWPLIFGKVGAVGVGIEKVGIGIQRHFRGLAWRNYLGPGSSIRLLVGESVAYYGFRVAAPSVLLAAEVGGVVMTGGTILVGGAVVGAVGYGGYKLYKTYKEESRKLGPNARWQDVWHKLIDDSSVPFEIRPPSMPGGRRG